MINDKVNLSLLKLVSIWSVFNGSLGELTLSFGYKWKLAVKTVEGERYSMVPMKDYADSDKNSKEAER